MVKKKRGVHKTLRNLGIATTLAAIIGGAGVTKYSQDRINEIEQPPQLSYSLAKIEKELNQPMSLDEFQNLQKESPEKFEEYMKMYNQYEKYLNSPNQERQRLEKRYEVKSAKRLETSGILATAGGLTGLGALLATAQKKKKRKANFLLTFALGGLITIVMIQSRITGNVISINYNSLNLISIVLFFITLVSFIFYFKIKNKL